MSPSSRATGGGEAPRRALAGTPPLQLEPALVPWRFVRGRRQVDGLALRSLACADDEVARLVSFNWRSDSAIVEEPPRSLK